MPSHALLRVQALATSADGAFLLVSSRCKWRKEQDDSKRRTQLARSSAVGHLVGNPVCNLALDYMGPRLELT